MAHPPESAIYYHVARGEVGVGPILKNVDLDHRSHRAGPLSFIQT